MLYQFVYESPLGNMVGLADDTHLHLLLFHDAHELDASIVRVQKRLSVPLVHEKNTFVVQVEQELSSYFAGTLKKFTIPCLVNGTSFQQQAWKALQDIACGSVVSYTDQAHAIGRLKAVRAVGVANSKNQIALIIPCHRVIGKNKKLTGYAGGLDRKQWLLVHEQEMVSR